MTSKEFRKLIADKCRTARWFADKVGITESMVSHILHGRRKIYDWNLDKFSQALGVSKEYLEEKLVKGVVGYDSKTGSRYFRLESEND